MKKLFKFIPLLFLTGFFITACSSNDFNDQNQVEEITNANPDPNGEEWTVGGSIPSQEEIKKLPSLAGTLSRSILVQVKLPKSVDNSTSKYFRPVFNQGSYGSCAQSSGIGYNFTYEMNVLRDADGSLAENQYPPHFTWNFLNGGKNAGSSEVPGWQIGMQQGIPTVKNFGGMTTGGYSGWMTGYDKYYDAMKNKVDSYYRIEIGTPEGLNTLKYWLYNHAGENNQTGGVANFSVCFTGHGVRKLADGTPEAGKSVVINWSKTRTGGHAMVFAGYNDDIRYDFNGDGKYTNDEDINGDGIIDMRDWEIGALLVVNSHGTSWGTQGKAYMMYKVIADNLDDGGMTDRYVYPTTSYTYSPAVYVLKVKKDYQPKLTMKVKLQHDSRRDLMYLVGIAEYKNVNGQLVKPTEPDYLEKINAFTHRGGDHPMRGQSNTDPIEIGLDISSLLNKVNTSNPVSIFLRIKEDESVFGDDGADLHNGEILSYSIIDYSNGVQETVCTSSIFPVTITNNATTDLTIDKNFSLIPPKNLSVKAEDKKVTLNWQAPVLQPTLYKVYKNNQFLINTASLSYIDTNVENEVSYQYCVSAVYSNGESVKTENITATPMKALSLPLCETFENGQFPPKGWSSDGTIKNPDNLYVPYYKGWRINDNGRNESLYYAGPGYRPAATRILTTATVDLATGDLTETPTLEFYWRNDTRKIEEFDKTYCEISTDNGSTWTTLVILEDQYDDSSFHKETISLASYQNQKVKIRWRDETCGDGAFGMVGMGLDDIKITRGTDREVFSTDIVSYDFGQQQQGDQGSKFFTIKNTGTKDLTGTIKAFNGYILVSETEKGETINYTVKPGVSQGFNIIFKPDNGGNFNGNIIITSSDSNNTQTTIPVSGSSLYKNYDQFYIMGSLNSWEANENYKMRLVADNTWKIENILFKTGDENGGPRFKFCTDNNWTVNFGDFTGDRYADQKGPDIAVNENHRYTITFNDSTKEYILEGTEVTGPAKVYFRINGTSSPSENSQLIGLTAELYKGSDFVANYEIKNESTGYSYPYISDDKMKVGEYTVKFKHENFTDYYFGEASFTINADYPSGYGNMNVTRVALADLPKVRVTYNLSGYQYPGRNTLLKGLIVKLYKGDIEILTQVITDEWSSSSYTTSYITDFVSLGTGNYTVKLNEIKSDKKYVGEIQFTVANDTKYLSEKMTVDEKDPNAFESNYEQVYLRGTYDNTNWQAVEASKMTLIADYTWSKKVTFGSSDNERFKFDINGDWEISFGDNNNDKIADLDGNDITVAANKTYVITFNDETKEYTLTEEDDDTPVLTVKSIDAAVPSVTLGWNDYGVRYQRTFIHRSDSIDGTYIEVAEVFNINYAITEWTDTSVVKGNTYYYKIYCTYNSDPYGVGKTTDFSDAVKAQVLDRPFYKTYDQVYLRGTYNDWNAADADKMTLVADYTWEKTVTFNSTSEERFKFDIYGNWNLNFGDNNNDKIAEQSGNDITVNSGVTVTIRFNDQSKVYSIVE